MEQLKEPKKGYVYILTNPAFRADWVKIGKSSRPVDIRSKELDNTAVPLPFEIYATLKTSKYSEVEKQIHKTIDRLSDLRIRQNREFFNISPADALEIMRDSASLLDDAEIAVYVDGKPVISESKEHDMAIADQNDQKKRRHPKPGFKFSMIGLKPGDFVTFDPLKLEVKVASDDRVEYDGRLYSLSSFAGNFMPEEQQNKSGSYQGPIDFSYKGKTLFRLRNEMDSGNFYHDASEENSGA